MSPDVVVEAETLTKAETALVRSGVVQTYVDDYLDGRPNLAADLFEKGSPKDADASGRVLDGADLRRLEAAALNAARTGKLYYSVDDKDDAKARATVERDLKVEFKAHGDRILRVADSLLKERFFRSSALLKAQLADDAAVTRAVTLLRDRRAFDALLEAPPGPKPSPSRP